MRLLLLLLLLLTTATKAKQAAQWRRQKLPVCACHPHRSTLRSISRSRDVCRVRVRVRTCSARIHVDYHPLRAPPRPSLPNNLPTGSTHAAHLTFPAFDDARPHGSLDGSRRALDLRHGHRVVTRQLQRPAPAVKSPSTIKPPNFKLCTS